jgi:ribosomal protein S18 acetylase RimI-like enzyme
MDESIVLPEPDEGLAAELNERIDEFNARATGIGDGRLLQAEFRDEGGALVAGLTGWTWGGCGYIDVLWVREDHRGRGLGRRLLDAAETEAYERGCTQIVTSSHSFQAPEMYRARGYVEYGRIDDYPRGFAHIHFVKDLLG